MNIVLGATGQIGSMLVDNLLKKEQPVRVVVRNNIKAQEFKNKGVEAVITDYSNLENLKKSLSGRNNNFSFNP